MKEYEFNKQDSSFEESESEDNKTYPIKEAKIEKQRFSVFELKRKIDSGNIIIDPDFQREYVWDEKRKSELIESILMGIPIPLIYTSQSNDGKMQIVDGKQRLSSLREFLNNKFELTGLKILDDINKKTFNKLNDLQKTKIEDYMFDIYMIVPPTPDEIKFDIFDRVNRGGVPINAQEMRNALYNGVATEVIKQLCKSEDFQKAAGDPDKSRMKDRYLALRFLAFYLLFNNKLNFTYTTLDTFLGKVMSFINKEYKYENFNELTANFDIAMSFIYKHYKDDLFRFSPKEEGKKRRKVSLALFESLSFAFILSLENKKKYPDIKKIDEFKKELDAPEKTILGVDGWPNIENRFNLAKGLLDDQ